MANLNVLAGFAGFLQGVSSGIAPFMQVTAQKSYLRERERIRAGEIETKETKRVTSVEATTGLLTTTFGDIAETERGDLPDDVKGALKKAGWAATQTWGMVDESKKGDLRRILGKYYRGISREAMAGQEGTLRASGIKAEELVEWEQGTVAGAISALTGEVVAKPTPPGEEVPPGEKPPVTKITAGRAGDIAIRAKQMRERWSPVLGVRPVARKGGSELILGAAAKAMRGQALTSTEDMHLREAMQRSPNMAIALAGDVYQTLTGKRPTPELFDEGGALAIFLDEYSTIGKRKRKK